MAWSRVCWSRARVPRTSCSQPHLYQHPFEPAVKREREIGAIHRRDATPDACKHCANECLQSFWGWALYVALADRTRRSDFA